MKEVKIGDTIKIIDMQDEPDYADRVGEVDYIDDAGQLHGSWGGLAVIPGVDSFEIIASEAIREKKRKKIAENNFKANVDPFDLDWEDESDKDNFEGTGMSEREISELSQDELEDLGTFDNLNDEDSVIEDFTGTPEERTSHLEKIDKDEKTIEYEGPANKKETKDIVSKFHKLVNLPEDEKKLQESIDEESVEIETEIGEPIEIETPTKEDPSNKILADLIIDEKEAIDGYNQAIDDLAADSGTTAKEIEVLKHIEDEELEHIEELSKVVSGAEEEIMTESLADGKAETHEEKIIDGLISELFDVVGYSKEQLVRACRKVGMTEDEINNFAINLEEKLCPKCGKKVCECKTNTNSLSEGAHSAPEEENILFDKVYDELFDSGHTDGRYVPYRCTNCNIKYTRDGFVDIGIVGNTKDDLKAAEDVAKKYDLEYKYSVSKAGDKYRITIYIPEDEKM